MDNKNEKIKINLFKEYFPKEMLQNLLNECLNNRLIKLETSTKNQMLNLNKTSKNFKDFSKSIQQISNNYLEQTELSKDKLDKKENTKNNNINENAMKQSFKKQLSKNNNNILNSFRARSNTLGLSKYNQLKKQNTEINLNKESFISNNNNTNNKQKLKSIEKNNKNKIIFLKKDLVNNVTPKKTNKIDFLIDSKTKYPKTEKITKKLKVNIKKINTSKNLKNNDKYMNELENLYPDNNKPIQKSFIKEKKSKITNEIKTNKTLNEKKETFLGNKNFNNLKASFSQRRERKLILNENNNINSINNNSNNFSDIQNIVKLVDNVNQNISKLLNNNNSVELPLNNILRNSANFTNKNNKKNEFVQIKIIKKMNLCLRKNLFQKKRE